MCTERGCVCVCVYIFLISCVVDTNLWIFDNYNTQRHHNPVFYFEKKKVYEAKELHTQPLGVDVISF
jgi:hypothetical protein